MPFRQLLTADEELNRVQSRITEAVKGIETIPLLSGNYITATIQTTDTIVEHKLQRKVIGWMVVDQNAAASVYKSASVNTIEDRQLILQASAPVTVKLYVF